MIPPLPGAMAATLCVNAMKDKQQVMFFYDDKARVVEAHAVGTSTKDGSLIMRGYQVSGDGEGWRLFTLKKIEAMFTGGVSHAPREAYRKGDKQMQEIIYEL